MNNNHFVLNLGSPTIIFAQHDTKQESFCVQPRTTKDHCWGNLTLNKNHFRGQPGITRSFWAQPGTERESFWGQPGITKDFFVATGH